MSVCAATHTHTPQVERALSKVGEVRTLMLILMLLEGCALFIAATVYVCLLVRKVRQGMMLASACCLWPALHDCALLRQDL